MGQTYPTACFCYIFKWLNKYRKTKTMLWCKNYIQITVYISKMLLEYSTAHHSCTVYGAFVLKRQSWLVATKPIQHQSQNTYSLALYETSLPTPDLDSLSNDDTRLKLTEMIVQQQQQPTWLLSKPSNRHAIPSRQFISKPTVQC